MYNGTKLCQVIQWGRQCGEESEDLFENSSDGLSGCVDVIKSCFCNYLSVVNVQVLYLFTLVLLSFNMSLQ